MKNILITDLSEKVLEEIYATGWTPKYKDRYRTEGVKPIVKYFDETVCCITTKKRCMRLWCKPIRITCQGKLTRADGRAFASAVRSCRKWLLMVIFQQNHFADGQQNQSHCLTSLLLTRWMIWTIFTRLSIVPVRQC